jgi:NAD(P)-dependent dehydrogenase (short-subunit alcohol dehydrogenase family)
MPISTTTESRRLVDPRTAYPTPPFPRQQQELPGRDVLLDPKPDHGEQSYVGTGRLSGLGTIVTGADSGVGKAIAIAFAREGADVLIAYLDADEDAQATVDLVEAAGRKAVAVRGDLRNESHCREVIERARSAFGHVDVLVNNAAVQIRHVTIEDITSDEWEWTLQTNLTSVFFLCRAAVPVMQPGSTIINVSSIQATQPSPSLLAYATTKGGLVTFSKALAEQVASRGIRVNVVAPGPVWTPLVAATTDPDGVSKFGGDSLLGRPAQPVELAPAFVYLASAESSFVTGAVLPVTGGEFFA